MTSNPICNVFISNLESLDVEPLQPTFPLVFGSSKLLPEPFTYCILGFSKFEQYQKDLGPRYSGKVWQQLQSNAKLMFSSLWQNI